jgi:uncharacterized protein (DUF2141 family)
MHNADTTGKIFRFIPKFRNFELMPMSMSMVVSGSGAKLRPNTGPKQNLARAAALAMAGLFAQSAHAQGDVPPAGCTGPVSATWITVVADGLRSSSGLLAITLYADDSKRFLVKHGSMYVGRVDATAGTTTGCIFVPKPGVYALALYHDENANQKFDRSGLGLPTEGYGFSNNPTTLLGLPKFNSVRLNITHTGLLTRVHMKYP